MEDPGQVVRGWDAVGCPMRYDKAKLVSAIRAFQFATESAYQQFGVDRSASKALWARVSRTAEELRSAAKFAPSEVQRMVGL